jgi:hypothetical protein
LFVRAVAKVERSVVIAAVISRPCFEVTCMELVSRERVPLTCYPSGMG